MPSHLLRCQGLAVDNHSFALGRLEAGTSSTFAQLRFNAKDAGAGRPIEAPSKTEKRRDVPVGPPLY
jgi:hypothetical protein